MELDPSMAGYTTKRVWLDHALDIFERGRLCAVGRCMEPADYAVTVQGRGRRAIEVGLCLAHVAGLNSEPPRVTLRRGWRVVSEPVCLDPDVILDGPGGDRG